MRYEVPIDVLGRQWAAQMTNAFAELAKLPEGRVMHVSYDKFCEEPAEQIKAIVEFCGANCSSAWAREATRSVKPSGGAWKSLPAGRQEALIETCRPGMELIRSYQNRRLVI
ncbi:MAG: sulfotransferase [Hyphomonadaceae bacterium]